MTRSIKNYQACLNSQVVYIIYITLRGLSPHERAYFAHEWYLHPDNKTNLWVLITQNVNQDAIPFLSPSILHHRPDSHNINMATVINEAKYIQLKNVM